MPTVTWLSLANEEPPSTWGTPANKYTPIFHMNGFTDRIVPVSAGAATERAMNQVNIYPIAYIIHSQCALQGF